MSSDPVKFTFKRKSDNKSAVIKNGIKDSEYITNTAEIVPKPSKKRKNLVIPPTKNIWQPSLIKNQNIDDITKEAIDQILKDPNSITLDNSVKSITSEDNLAKDVSSLQFPSVVPQKESTLEDYGNVQISDFGKALLRGMGWEEGTGVGRSRKLVHPINFDTRKRTLGVTVHEEEAAEAERLMHEFRLGDYVEITSGQHKGKYAKILSTSLETSRCVVRLPSDEMVDAAIIGIKMGNREEYLKQRDATQETDIYMFAKTNSTVSKQPSSVNNMKTTCYAESINKPCNTWLHRDLKVRIVSEGFLKGKYYCKKVDIVDVVDPFTCTCRNEKGKLLENVPQSILETVIPKEKGTLVMLLSKKHRFEIAELEEKDSKSGNVVCVTLIEKEVVIASFNEVCQYVGDAVL